jgi:hypothetical protein
MNKQVLKLPRYRTAQERYTNVDANALKNYSKNMRIRNDESHLQLPEQSPHWTRRTGEEGRLGRRRQGPAGAAAPLHGGGRLGDWPTGYPHCTGE